MAVVHADGFTVARNACKQRRPRALQRTHRLIGHQLAIRRAENQRSFAPYPCRTGQRQHLHCLAQWWRSLRCNAVRCKTDGCGSHTLNRVAGYIGNIGRAPAFNRLNKLRNIGFRLIQRFAPSAGREAECYRGLPRLVHIIAHTVHSIVEQTIAFRGKCQYRRNASLQLFGIYPVSANAEHYPPAHIAIRRQFVEQITEKLHFLRIIGHIDRRKEILPAAHNLLVYRLHILLEHLLCNRIGNNIPAFRFQIFMRFHRHIIIARQTHAPIIAHPAALYTRTHLTGSLSQIQHLKIKLHIAQFAQNIFHIRFMFVNQPFIRSKRIGRTAKRQICIFKFFHTPVGFHFLFRRAKQRRQCPQQQIVLFLCTHTRTV